MIRGLPYEAALMINEIATGNCVVRDRGGLESALARPFQSAFGQDIFPTLVEKGAVLLHGIATSHAFLDGNKRTGWTACVTFLGMNGVRVLDDSQAGPMVLRLVEERQDHLPAALFLSTRVDDR